MMLIMLLVWSMDILTFENNDSSVYHFKIKLIEIWTNTDHADQNRYVLFVS